MVKYGTQERPLIAKNTGAIRVWRRFETLASYLKEMGVTQFEVDTARYDQESAATTRRPDRAEALRKAHEAAAYDKWFREQVLAAIDDPRPSIPDNEVKTHFARKRDALRKRIEQGQSTP